MSRGYRVLETRYPRGSTWHFCPGMICKKPLTRVSKTRVLLESRVLETRDAIIIYCFRIGQLTILLHTLCHLARGFPNFLSLSVFTGKQSTVRNSYEEIKEALHIAHYILFKGRKPNVNSNYLFIWA